MQPLSLAAYEVPLLVVNRLLPLVSRMIAATLADLQYVDKKRHISCSLGVYYNLHCSIQMKVSEIRDDDTPVHNVHGSSLKLVLLAVAKLSY